MSLTGTVAIVTGAIRGFGLATATALVQDGAQVVGVARQQRDLDGVRHQLGDAFIPVSIGALAGVTERDTGVASGLLNTAQQLGGAIGVAVASTVATSHFHTMVAGGHPAAAALTGGFQWALWVCGITGLAAVPVAFALIRRREMARSVSAQRDATPATETAVSFASGG